MFRESEDIIMNIFFTFPPLKMNFPCKLKSISHFPLNGWTEKVNGKDRKFKIYINNCSEGSSSVQYGRGRGRAHPGSHAQDWST